MPQNQLMITIIDESGSKQLKFSKNLKRNLIISVIIFLLIVGLGVGFLKFLIAKMDTMTGERNAVLRDFRDLYQKNYTLTKEIKNKREELFIVGQKIRTIESLIEVKRGANGGVHLYDEVDLENLNLAQKHLALMLIPNGMPLKTYSAIKPTKERNHPIKKLRALNPGLILSRH